VLIFVVITMYGQWVLMGVLEEKTTNMAEQILPSISVRTLLAGKIIGIGLLGFAQMIVFTAGGLLTVQFLGSLDIPQTAYPTAAWAFVWFVLGFAFYAVLYAAAGSLVSRTEDAQAASTPVVLIGVISYMAAFSLVVPNPDSMAARIASMTPSIAPFAFPARVASQTVPLWELLVGVGVMLLAVVAVTRLAARVYAGALLAGGGRIKMRKAWKAAGELVSGR